MTNDTDFFAKRINSAIIVASLLGPFAWLCMLIILTVLTTQEHMPIKIFMDCVLQISFFFLVIPLCLHIYRKKVLLKKHPHLAKKKRQR
ncbi:hypothetical protein ACH95_03340 [Bacillus glycinifermentans]|uniref:Uncharacterized protein n=1 Tax=Bacillus glycinifermentans TaxID=1664069 RepID=A0A0J6ER88_9BACI|nr:MULTISPECIES: hypothetical protein [Bacillus]ATH94347.1 hypothetical protein COP00_18445 [Bacillus glycinifermentans]KKB71525.1 hypothetical protein TH62_22690 [Bacillus sp. TH008]KMM63001.1 hypothetical protein ACH95_03340 [Bacillus glycinifermentans]KRT95771.1 hypothetical protein AB447_201320 [Bacillus glycinifermentans]MBU8786019.1 hypothetical protein [Bacillus glycinifermentans]